MSHLFEEEKNLIINEVVVRIQQKLPKMKAALCSEFVRQFYLTMSLEDLKESSIDDLFGLAVNFWGGYINGVLLATALDYQADIATFALM